MCSQTSTTNEVKPPEKAYKSEIKDYESFELVFTMIMFINYVNNNNEYIERFTTHIY